MRQDIEFAEKVKIGEKSVLKASKYGLDYLAIEIFPTSGIVIVEHRDPKNSHAIIKKAILSITEKAIIYTPENIGDILARKFLKDPRRFLENVGLSNIDIVEEDNESWEAKIKLSEGRWPTFLQFSQGDDHMTDLIIADEIKRRKRK